MPSMGYIWLRSSAQEQKEKQLNMKYVVITFLAFVLAACGGQERSETLKKAEAIHLETLEISKGVVDKIAAVTSELEDASRYLISQGDTLAAEEVDLKMQKLHAIADSYETWKDNLAEVPGMACTHDHNGEHEHNHDHAKEALLSGLSDNDNLKIQEEQKLAIESILSQLTDLE